MKYRLMAVVAAAGLLISPLFAQTPGAGPMGKGESTKGDPVKKASMSEGEVRKIDKEQGKITLKHGELQNLGMPSMTMVFKVKDPALLDKLNVGDSVQFVADRVDGALTVTAIEKKAQ